MIASKSNDQVAAVSKVTAISERVKIMGCHQSTIPFTEYRIEQQGEKENTLSDFYLKTIFHFSINSHVQKI